MSFELQRLAIPDERFAAEIEQRAGWVLAFFAADWCGPSRQMRPNIARTRDALVGRLHVIEVNYDRAPAASGRYEVRSLPTMLLFRDGRVIGRQVGSMPEAHFRRWIDGVMAEAE